MSADGGNDDGARSIKMNRETPDLLSLMVECKSQEQDREKKRKDQ